MVSRSMLPFQTAGLPLTRGLGGDPLLALHREMNRMFDDVLRGSGLPAVAVYSRGVQGPV